MLVNQSDVKRFFDKTAVVLDGCWEWRASKNNGYGQFWHNNKWGIASRFVYELCVGKIENQIDHLCRNRGCVNPLHLEDVTTQENTKRGNSGLFNSSKTHCPQGHPYSGNNLYVRKSMVGVNRGCRTCLNLRSGTGEVER